MTGNNPMSSDPEDRVGSGGKQQSGSTLLIPDKFDLVADDFALEDSQEDQELKELERRLNTEVEEDLFEEPRKFKYVVVFFIIFGVGIVPTCIFVWRTHERPLFRLHFGTCNLITARSTASLTCSVYK